MVDGEIVVAAGDRLDFEALLQRIHPAESRVDLLAEQTPASLVAFDLLALGDESLSGHSARRAAGRSWTRLLGQVTSPVHLTSVTDDPALAREWFGTFEGAGLDGVVAKPVDGPYEPDKRTMFKVKHERTADCVVAGFRWHKTSTPDKPLLGSLLLGLYDEDGRLQHVGVVASFPIARRAELHRGAGAAGGRTRWPTTPGGTGPRRRPSRGADAGRAVPVERQEGPVLGAAAPRAGGRGRLRPHGGDPVPAHHPVPSAGATTATRPPARYEQLEVPVSYDLSSLLSPA